MNKATIIVTLNQQILHIEVPVQQSLLSFLRDTLNLTATKNGCNGGECGACMVLLDDEPVNSCMVLAVECDQHRVDTLERLNEMLLMQGLQNAFLEQGAVQCGFCTPGMLISAYTLLRANSTRNRRNKSFKPCQGICAACTGYQVIIQAIQRAAKELLSARLI